MKLNVGLPGVFPRWYEALGVEALLFESHQGSYCAGAQVLLNQREENAPRAIIEKTRVKDAVFRTVKLRSEIAHRKDVITNESYRANRRIIAQLDSSIDIFHQGCAVGIYCPG